MALDEATVRKIAHLARIEVPDGELGGLADELSNILDWVEQLGEVDTDGVAPMTSVVEASLRLRADSRIRWFAVEVENFESIHAHNAFAAIEQWLDEERSPSQDAG